VRFDDGASVASQPSSQRELDIRRAVARFAVVDGDTLGREVREVVHDGALRAGITAWAVQEAMTGPWWGLLLECGVDDDAVARLHRERVLRSLACEAMALRAVETLSGAGVECWLLKGLAAANCDYGDPAMRTSVDADVLVRRADLASAVTALTNAGLSRAIAAPRPRWESRHARAVLLHGPSHLELDLHLALATGYFGAVLPMQDVVADSETLVLGAVRCGVLGRPARALHSCYAAVLSRGSRLRYLCDFALQAAHPEMDTEAFLHLAHRGDGTAVVARAIRMTREWRLIDGAHPLVAWASNARPSRRAARALELADVAARRGWSADARSAMLSMGPVSKVAFLAEFVVPPAGSERRLAGTLRSARRFLGSR